MSFRLKHPSPVIGGTEPTRSPCHISRGMTTSSCGWGVRIANYTINKNLITKVLDFVQLGGPECTVDGTIFEMWLGGL